jgi:hypothetical protein
MAVPYTFASATTSIPLSELDANFATTITLGNTAIQLGNTVTTLNNMTLANATISSGNVTVTSITAGQVNSTGAVIASGAGQFGDDVDVTGDITADNITLDAGTANGVLYLNGSKVATSGSALTFDGTTFTNTGNTVLGDASTDTVTVNGYMAIGGVASNAVGLYLGNTALSGTSQVGVYSQPYGTSAATSYIAGVLSTPNTAASAFTCSDMMAFRAGGGSKGAGSTITNQHGLYIVDQAQGTNNYGITSLVSSGANKWNIYASGTAQNYFAGNVGIGTSTPARKLNVFDTTSTPARIETNTADTKIEIITTSGTQYIQGSSNNLLFGTNNTERMRINSSGNVGIGTSSPTQKLEVSYLDSTTNRTNPVNVAAITATSATAGGAVYNGFGPALVFRSQSYNGTVYNGPRVRMVINDNSTQTTNGSSLAFDVTATKGASPTEAMLLDSSGNLGLGVTPSAWNANLKAIDIGAYGSHFCSSGGDSGISHNQVYDTTGTTKYKNNGYALLYIQNANGNTGNHAWFTAPSGTAGNAISFTQAMTLDASGNLLVGTTSGSSNQYTAGSLNLGGSVITAGYKYCIISYNSGGSGAAVSFQKAGSERAAMFYNESDSRLYVFNNQSSFGVYMASNATSWTANSDERLKTDLVPIENAAQKVSTLRAVTGRYKTDEEGVSRSFLIAQDVQAVLPEAVSVGSMPMSEDKTQYLGVSYTDVIPLLVAAIKEQQAIIEQLKSRLDAAGL